MLFTSNFGYNVEMEQFISLFFIGLLAVLVINWLFGLGGKNDIDLEEEDRLTDKS